MIAHYMAHQLYETVLLKSSLATSQGPSIAKAWASRVEKDTQ